MTFLIICFIFMTNYVVSSDIKEETKTSYYIAVSLSVLLIVLFSLL